MSTYPTISLDPNVLARVNDPHTCDAAFGELYDALGRYVYIYALRMTSCANDASDITQDTFLRVHEHLRRGNRLVDALPFCLMIARQRVINLRRDRKPTVAVEETHAIADLTVDVERADLHQHVERAVAALPLLLRDAFVLRYYDGLDYDVIAHMSGVPAGTIRVRVMRAKAALRQLLAHVSEERG